MSFVGHQYLGVQLCAAVPLLTIGTDRTQTSTIDTPFLGWSLTTDSNITGDTPTIKICQDVVGGAWVPRVLTDTPTITWDMSILVSEAATLGKFVLSTGTTPLIFFISAPFSVGPGDIFQINFNLRIV